MKLVLHKRRYSSISGSKALCIENDRAIAKVLVLIKDKVHLLMHMAYISLGTNLGNKVQNLQAAIYSLKNCIGEVVSESAIYKSESWGFVAPIFLNQVILVETKLEPLDLLFQMKEIEKCMGREEKALPGYKSRIIDMDIIFYDAAIVNEGNLIIPHPEMQNRLFVLKPLNEIAKDYTHPVLLKTVNQLLINCTDKCKTEKYYN